MSEIFALLAKMFSDNHMPDTFEVFYALQKDVDKKTSVSSSSLYQLVDLIEPTEYDFTELYLSMERYIYEIIKEKKGSLKIGDFVEYLRGLNYVALKAADQGIKFDRDYSPGRKGNALDKVQQKLFAAHEKRNASSIRDALLDIKRYAASNGFESARLKDLDELVIDKDTLELMTPYDAEQKAARKNLNYDKPDLNELEKLCESIKKLEIFDRKRFLNNFYYTRCVTQNDKISENGLALLSMNFGNMNRTISGTLREAIIVGENLLRSMNIDDLAGPRINDVLPCLNELTGYMYDVGMVKEADTIIDYFTLLALSRSSHQNWQLEKVESERETRLSKLVEVSKEYSRRTFAYLSGNQRIPASISIDSERYEIKYCRDGLITLIDSSRVLKYSRLRDFPDRGIMQVEYSAKPGLDLHAQDLLTHVDRVTRKIAQDEVTKAFNLGNVSEEGIVFVYKEQDLYTIKIVGNNFIRRLHIGMNTNKNMSLDYWEYNTVAKFWELKETTGREQMIMEQELLNRSPNFESFLKQCGIRYQMQEFTNAFMKNTLYEDHMDMKEFWLSTYEDMIRSSRPINHATLDYFYSCLVKESGTGSGGLTQFFNKPQIFQHFQREAVPIYIR